jgi:hypothetical protein
MSWLKLRIERTPAIYAVVRVGAVRSAVYPPSAAPEATMVATYLKSLNSNNPANGV